jgi:hypothetical protein
MLKGIKEIIPYAEGHGIGHTEALEKIKIEFFLIVAKVVVIGALEVNFNLIGRCFF